MVNISDITDLHRFLSFLCIQLINTQYPTGIANPYLTPSNPSTGKFNQDDLDELSFWEDKLSSYVITGREPILNFDYGTVIILYTEAPGQSDFFASNDHFIIKSNLGIFLAHSNEQGYLKEFELYFRSSLFPPFLPALIKSIPVDQEVPSKLLREILKSGVVQVDQLESEFQERKFATIEVG